MKTIKEWCEYIKDWRIKKKFDTGWNNVPEKLMLIVTELAEAMEAYRKMTINPCPVFYKVDEYSDNFKEELADTTIRIMDLCGSLGIDLEEEIAKKMEYNETRPEKHGKKL